MLILLSFCDINRQWSAVERLSGHFLDGFIRSGLVGKLDKAVSARLSGSLVEDYFCGFNLSETAELIVQPLFIN